MADDISPDDTSTDALLTLIDLCRQTHADAAWITELVDYGVIEPRGASGGDWHFESLTVVRVAKAKRLVRDLSLNSAGVAVVFDLLDQIENLKAQLRAGTR